MRIFREEGDFRSTFVLPLTSSSAQQAVVVLDARDQSVRPGDTDLPNSVWVRLVDGDLLTPGDEANWEYIAFDEGRPVIEVLAYPPDLVRTVVASFDPEPGEVLILLVESDFVDDWNNWKLRVLLDGLGTLPLVIEPALAGETIDTEQEDGSFITSIQLDIHHLDAELEDTTWGVQTVGVATQFDAATGTLLLGPGQLLEKNMETGETHLLARILSPIEFPVAVNYFPDAAIEASFSRDLAGLSLDITDMMLTEHGAAFGFETYMPAEIGGFFVSRGAFSAPDGEMLVTRRGIEGAPVFTAPDAAGVRLFDRFVADLSDIRVAYDKAADRLTATPEITLRNFLLNGLDLPLSFSAGGGLVVEGGVGRLQGELAAIGTYSLGPEVLNLTLEGMTLDLSDPVDIKLTTGVALDIGFGFITHFDPVVADVAVTEDFALDELVLAFPTIPDLPVLPPWLLLTAATIGAYGLAPGGAAPRLSIEADLSFLPDIPLPDRLGDFVDLGQISLALDLGTEGLQGTGHATFGSMGGGALITVDTAAVLDFASRELTLSGIGGLGAPVLGNGAIMSSFTFTTGLGGSSMQARMTFATPENVAWVLGLAGLPDPFALTLDMSGRFNRWGDLSEQVIEGSVALGILGFEVELGARMRMDGDIDFHGYDLTDLPDFVEADAGSRSATQRQGMEARAGQDLAMRTVGSTEGVALIGPDGTLRTLEELEADATDGITVLRDAAGASIFIADAAAGRWAIEAAGGNGFLAMEEQQALAIAARRTGRDDSILDITVTAPEGVELVHGQLDVLRARDASGAGAELAGSFAIGAGTTRLGLMSLDLPPGDWTLLLRVRADNLLPAETVLDEPVPITTADQPDLGILRMRWVEQPAPEESGLHSTWALEIVLREHGGMPEVGTTAQLRVGGELIGDGGLFDLPGVRPGGTRTLLLDFDGTITGPPPGEDLRATLALMDAGRDTNLANNTASATLFTTQDGVTANLVLGTGAAEALRGTEAGDVVKGLGGADRLVGLVGDDTLLGARGGDLLLGGAGADSLVGGADDDTYLVQDAGDRVLEERGGGHDRVVAALDWTLGAEVERLSLSGTGDLGGTGNGLANRLDGNAGANRLAGGAGDDRLHGNDGADTLLGEAGDDALIGATGNDLLRGGLGADVLLGGDGADTLVGGEARDVLLGGRGADLFVLGPPGAAADVLRDFDPAMDLIGLVTTDFSSGWSAGMSLDAMGLFRLGGLGDATVPGQILFDAAAQALWWDADGAGGDRALLLARLPGVSAMSADSVLIL
jgi:hypothetical protein